VWGGALSIVSTVIGGGIVGLPFAMVMLGIVVGIPLNLLVCMLVYLSGIVYLKL